MRILLITPTRLEDPTYRHVLCGLGAAYRSLGHEAAAAGQMEPEAGGLPVEEASWGRIHRSGGRGRLKGASRALRTFLETRRLLQAADFVHVVAPLAWSLRLVAIEAACRWMRKPRGLTLQSCANPELPAARRWRRGPLNRFLSRFSWVTVLSRGEKNALAALTNAPARIVPNGFDPVERDQAPPAPSPRPFVLCVARFSKYKGLDVLLMAWSDVCRRSSEIDLVIAGAGPLAAHLESLAGLLGIGARVRFAGVLPRPQLWGSMKSCLFLVLPSRYESFGIAALEAMACGKAVVATRCGGPEEFIADEVTGLLLPPEDAGALGAAVSRLLEDPALRERLGARAREAARGYRWEDAAGRYLELARP
ncbi:MAG: glycosyltransferase family 4 protein [Elusimicrobiota bacterium]